MRVLMLATIAAATLATGAASAAPSGRSADLVHGYQETREACDGAALASPAMDDCLTDALAHSVSHGAAYALGVKAASWALQVDSGVACSLKPCSEDYVKAASLTWQQMRPYFGSAGITEHATVMALFSSNADYLRMWDAYRFQNDANP